MIQGKIIDIGAQAVSEEPMLIFFGKTATEVLKKHSVIQEIAKDTTFQLKTGDAITIGKQEYQVTHVGKLANDNLNAIQHVTFIFAEAPAEDSIVNGVYLTPHQVPQIQIGDTISYK